MATRWRNRVLSLSVIICVAMTATWAAIIAIGTLMSHPPIKTMQFAEAARNGSWIFLLFVIYGNKVKGSNHILANRRWLPWYTAGMVLVFVFLFALPWVLDQLDRPNTLEIDLYFILWACFSLAVLVMVEQIFRQSNEAERWTLKYLCLALAFMYGYDFLMYSQGLVMRQLSPSLWQARGAIVACCAPLIAAAVLRSHTRTIEIQVSRNVVFHTFTLLAAGVYLLYMAAVGYAINYVGGSLGGVTQITFLTLSGLIFIALMMSVRVRGMVRVWLSKLFFSYRYDYRREWLDFTRILAEGSGNTSAVTQAMAKLCGSPAGLLWMRTEADTFTLIDHWHMDNPGPIGDISGLADWLEKRVWIIEFQELRETPELYSDLEVPEALKRIPGAWLIVPLMFTDRLQGILLLCKPGVVPHINWEDRDLLKVAGRAAATYLAQYQANNTLVELRQFEAFNRLSAYVVHDLKNILAQQSLIVYNAEHHRNEPEFLDDVFDTINNSVERMRSLMAQMRSGVRGAERELIELAPVLQSVVDNRSEIQPVPRFDPPTQAFFVEADEEQLAAVFGHIIQNAQEATPKEGSVTIRIEPADTGVYVIVEDTGSGMEKDFIDERLFKPFDSTKGLTGMGIGAYESREYVRGLGGEIYVKSTPGKGSSFSIMLPCAPQTDIKNIKSEDAVGE